MLCSMELAEREALFMALVYLARADGEMAEEEVLFLDAIGREMDVDGEKLRLEAERQTLAQIVEPIADGCGRRKLLMELMRLAFRDGDFSVAESRGISDIATALEVGDRTLVAMEKWARDETAWLARGQELLEEGR